ncbi:hypothetical protein HAX54_031086 [Datura stramonium]|uniref:Uncharacterized protein n=1 Tax=Datura stramonium TaxID=4076 RepID=A0ABS8V8K6_DATST|nr:hypothetical protein [Datura stramonium]
MPESSMTIMVPLSRLQVDIHPKVINRYYMGDEYATTNTSIYDEKVLDNTKMRDESLIAVPLHLSTPVPTEGEFDIEKVPLEVPQSTTMPQLPTTSEALLF